VLGGCAEVCRNDLCRPLARDAGHLYLDAESLGFHGVSSLCPAFPACGSAACLPPATHTSLRCAGKASRLSENSDNSWIKEWDLV